MMVPLEKLCPHPNNRAIDYDKVNEYVASIRINGLLQDPVITPNDDGTYTILSGHHRIAAVRKLAAEDATYLMIDCKVKKPSEMDAELMLIDSNLTKPLTSYETMNAIGRKEEIFKFKIANGELGKGGALRDIVAAYSPMLKSTQIGKYLRVYKRATDTVKNALKDNCITLEQAAILSTYPADQQDLKLLQKKAKEKDVFTASLEHQLQQKLGTKVNLNKHQLQITYTDNDDLNRILELLNCLEEEL